MDWNGMGCEASVTRARATKTRTVTVTVTKSKYGNESDRPRPVAGLQLFRPTTRPSQERLLYTVSPANKKLTNTIVKQNRTEKFITKRRPRTLKNGKEKEEHLGKEGFHGEGAGRKRREED
jgi:hypothetical protein